MARASRRVERPKEVTPRQLGNHIYHHEYRTQHFTQQWQGLMLKLAWVLAFGAAYSTWQVLQAQGDAWQMTPALAFEIFSLAQAAGTTMYLQSNGHHTALQLCIVLTSMQLFAVVASAYNRRFPPGPHDPPMLLLGLVRDFKVLPDDAFPTGAVYFALCWFARRTMARQLRQASRNSRSFGHLPAEAILRASGVESESAAPHAEHSTENKKKV